MAFLAVEADVLCGLQDLLAPLFGFRENSRS
jgi:hypothetical protein